MWPFKTKDQKIEEEKQRHYGWVISGLLQGRSIDDIWEQVDSHYCGDSFDRGVSRALAEISRLFKRLDRPVINLDVASVPDDERLELVHEIMYDVSCNKDSGGMTGSYEICFEDVQAVVSGILALYTT